MYRCHSYGYSGFCDTEHPYCVCHHECHKWYRNVNIITNLKFDVTTIREWRYLANHRPSRHLVEMGLGNRSMRRFNCYVIILRVYLFMIYDIIRAHSHVNLWWCCRKCDVFFACRESWEWTTSVAIDTANTQRRFNENCFSFNNAIMFHTEVLTITKEKSNEINW